MTAQEPRSRQPKQLDAGISQAEISSFALRLAAEGKAAKTIRTYTGAVQWFAAGRLPGRASWEQAGRQDIQQWMTWLLDRYSNPRTSTPETSPPAPSPAGSRCVILAVGTGGIGTETASAGPSGCPAWPTLNP